MSLKLFAVNGSIQVHYEDPDTNMLIRSAIVGFSLQYYLKGNRIKRVLSDIEKNRVNEMFHRYVREGGEIGTSDDG